MEVGLNEINLCRIMFKTSSRPSILYETWLFFEVNLYEPIWGQGQDDPFKTTIMSYFLKVIKTFVLIPNMAIFKG